MALATDLFQPLEVPSQNCIIPWKNFTQLLREFSPAPTFREAIEHPCTLLRPLNEAGVAQQLQVPADARLALAEDLGHFGNRKLGAREKRQ
jgi:hypothetical protein